MNDELLCCPECGELTTVQGRRLVDNRTIGCDHCGSEVLITRLPDRYGHLHRPKWVLCPLMSHSER